MTTERDPMLDELGAGPGKEKVSLVSADPEIATEKKNRKDPLEVAAEVRRSSAAKEKTAKEKELRGYAVTVTGEYLAPAKDSPGRKVKMPYTVTAKVKTLDGALSTIVKYLLTDLIKKDHPEMTSVYTHHMVKAEPLAKDMPESTNLQYMPLKRLLEFVRDYSVPVDPANYPDDEGVTLRASVIDWKQNPKDFEKREALRVEEMKKKAELAELNK